MMIAHPPFLYQLFIMTYSSRISIIQHVVRIGGSTSLGGSAAFGFEGSVSHELGAEHDSSSKSLRYGRWTKEEESFVGCIIRTFERGLLPISPGTSLRTYLAERLSWYIRAVYLNAIDFIISANQFLIYRVQTNTHYLLASAIQ